MLFHNPFCNEAFVQIFRKAEKTHAVVKTLGYNIPSWSPIICFPIILSCNMCVRCLVLSVAVLKVGDSDNSENTRKLRGFTSLCSWFLSHYIWRYRRQGKRSSEHLWAQNVHQRVHRIT
jgi:hypothetical protein